MYALLIVIIAILFMLTRAREHFVVKIGNPFKKQEVISFNKNGPGYEVLALSPDTCPLDNPEYDAGLCYKRCKRGYHGILSVCWADTKNIGSGLVPELRDCPAGWVNTGLFCNEEIKCDPIDTHGSWMPWKWTGGGCRGGRVEQRLNACGVKPKNANRIGELFEQPKDAGAFFGKLGSFIEGDKGRTQNNPDLIDGLCYKSCPNESSCKNKRDPKCQHLPKHVPGMPYLCGPDGALSYDRGVGQVPKIFTLFGKWGF